MFVKGLLHSITTVVLCLYASIIFGAPVKKPTITILSNNFSSYKSNIAKSIELSELSQKYQINSVTIENWRSKNNSDLYIALGQEALTVINQQKIKKPILAALITSSDWNQHFNNQQYSNTSSIFYDPDPIKQLLLISHIDPSIKSLGILHSEQYILDKETLSKAAKSHSINLKFLINKNLEDFYNEYAELSNQTDGILLIPDKQVYNRNSVPKAILGSYRQEKFTFGYSKGLVQSGALASTFTSLNDYIKDLIESAENLLNNPNLQFSRFSQYYSVETNNKVAKSLDHILLTNTQLKEKIDQSILNLEQ